MRTPCKRTRRHPRSGIVNCVVISDLYGQGASTACPSDAAVQRGLPRSGIIRFPKNPSGCYPENGQEVDVLAVVPATLLITVTQLAPPVGLRTTNTCPCFQFAVAEVALAPLAVVMSRRPVQVQCGTVRVNGGRDGAFNVRRGFRRHPREYLVSDHDRPSRRPLLHACDRERVRRMDGDAHNLRVRRERQRVPAAAGNTTALKGAAGNFVPSPACTTKLVPDEAGDGAVATVLYARFLCAS